MGIATALRTTPHLGWFFCLHRAFYTDPEFWIKARQPPFGQLLSCTQWPCEFQPLSIEPLWCQSAWPHKCWVWLRGDPLESVGRRCERFDVVPCRLLPWPIAWEELQGLTSCTRDPRSCWVEALAGGLKMVGRYPYAPHSCSRLCPMHRGFCAEKSPGVRCRGYRLSWRDSGL